MTKFILPFTVSKVERNNDRRNDILIEHISINTYKQLLKQFWQVQKVSKLCRALFKI